MSRIVALALVVTLTTGCMASSLAHVDSARSEATRQPGARQARDLAEAVSAAYEDGAYDRDPKRKAADAGDAVAALDRAIPDAGIDMALLMAWRGIMYALAGRNSEILPELEASFRVGPTLLAARVLVPSYGGDGDRAKVGVTCRATAKALRDDDERMQLIDLCRKHMNAASAEGEMAWMPADLVAWYQQENARRERAAAIAAAERAQREREEQRVVRHMEQCGSLCKEEGLRCQNHCYGDDACDQRCVEMNHACLDRCESVAHEALGR
ncbi:MAG: hypothetical protein U1F43_20225 [Myxococcota bacterium]